MFIKDHYDCKDGNKKAFEGAFAIVAIRLIMASLWIMTEEVKKKKKRQSCFYTYLKRDGEDFKK